ncbi:A/G-specific adenine glycosylase [Coxiella endosymbiont of Amblyomma nuttalli]|uniref:A/G-specific adenine glycosylase n=1 Tax=Coxiella endosymbiont of Amblyomma nuttalli TaxID=2749996 RepID=UPI001FD4E2F7|nr:A/G-specific adenine glycosylase [Coxiella endosymbiont of Amblyomma nuttalli]
MKFRSSVDLVMDSKQFALAILDWFERCGRHDLPWQSNATPYRVWVSEIMLQQTRVSTVIPYFQHFIKSFPTIEALALTKIDNVLAHWSGLGYYARARNLHLTAQIIYKDHRGHFPKTVAALSALPGIGRSTAGAILSLGMNKYAIILDGNIKRVLARFCAIDIPTNQYTGINLLWNFAEKYTPKNRCWDYNQAMMDIGAIICTRTKPKCILCPLKTGCVAYQQSRQVEFPIKKQKSNRYKKIIYMLLLQNPEGNILLQKRPQIGIWGGLWSFPECSIEENIEAWCRMNLGIEATVQEQWSSFFHQFTHFQLEIKPVLLQVKRKQTHLIEYEPQIWYKKNSVLPGGIAAPVSRLLNQLTQK